MELKKNNSHQNMDIENIIRRFRFGAFGLMAGLNFALFSGSRGNYTELDKEEYPLFITMTLGSETYVIGNESFGIALKTEKKDSFLCNLGLC